MRSNHSAVLAAWLAILLLADVGTARGSENESRDGDARQQWMLGYLKAEQAAAATRDQRLVLARQLYTEALTVFQSVGRSYPDWNPDLVSYRTAYCTDQLRRLEEAAAAALDGMSRSDLIVEVRRLRETRQELDGQSQALAAKTERLESALASALKESTAARDTVAKLAADLVQVRAHETELQGRVGSLATDLKAREADLNRLQAAAGDAVSMRTSLAELDRRAQAADRWKQEAEAARARVDILHDKLLQATALEQESSLQADRARRESDALRSERDVLLRSARDAKERLELAEQAGRTAAGDLQTTLKQLAEVHQQAEAATRQCSEAQTQTKEAREAAAAMRQEDEALKRQVAELLSQLRSAQTEDSARLKKAHEEAVQQAAECRAALERGALDLAAARAAQERLTAEKESALRSAQETAAAALRSQAELRQMEHDAAGALATGDLAKAETHLRRILELDPQAGHAAARLGALLADRGDASAAEPLLRRARLALPDDPDVLLRLGLIHLRRGKAAMAVAALLEATAAAPDRADIHHSCGVALVEAGWRDPAEHELAKAFQLDSKRPDSAYCLAALLAAAGPTRRNEAFRWYERALALGAAHDANLDRFFAAAK